MTVTIRRRELLAALGGAAAWPLAARAQQTAMPVIGYLHSASPEPYSPMIAAFRQGLAEAGYVDGQNVTIDYHWAEGQFNRLPALAAELVARQPAILVAGGGSVSAVAAKAATTTVPIVFTIGADPVGSGLVSNLSRPSGNLTGVTFFTITLGPKRLELLRELLPKAGKIAMLVNPRSLNPDAKEVQEAARALGQSVHVLDAASEGDVDTAFRSLAQERDDALIVVSDPLFTSRREQIVALANYHRVPAIYPLREYVASGGLVSYGASIKDAYRQSGVYAGRLLKGAKPSDLPVLQPTKFELVINLKTAKTLGLQIPDRLLARADEVIE
jgi:putative tryptophan/tyrosine transport system substrate-binding protein